MQTPHDGKHLGSIFGATFGVRDSSSTTEVPPEYVPFVASIVDEVLSTLTPREEKVMRMRFGLGGTGREHTQQQIADHFAVSRWRIREVEKKALRKLRHPSRSRALKQFLQSPDEALSHFLAQRTSDERLVALTPVIENVNRLEPELIAHLKTHSDDLVRINPFVFEHLVAEFLASHGFGDVRLVGRNPRTSADIYAAQFINGLNESMKIFVEVKRWRDTVGINIINEVLGAFLGEKERFGWHAAMIVTVGGFKDFEKWSRQELRLKGL